MGSILSVDGDDKCMTIEGMCVLRRGIKRNLRFCFDITLCDMHDLPVTVNKGRSIEGFFPGRCQGGVLFTFISMEMREEQSSQSRFLSAVVGREPVLLI